MFIKEITEQTRMLYRSAFPPEERRPEGKIIVDDERFSFNTIVNDKGRELGLMTIWIFPDFNYIEHFAVFPELRGCGIGTEALRLIPDPVVLEIEPPDTGTEAKNRMEFYRRNGFRELDHEYIQPPYSSELSPVPLRLMARGNFQLSPSEISRILHNEVYRAFNGI